MGIPDLSVIIAARDAAATIGEQLSALAEQKWSGEWELVVVDNGSSDDTRAVVASYAAEFPRLRLLSSPSGGQYHARNVGIEATAGRNLAFLDADDVVGHDWLAAMAGALSAHLFVTGPLEVERLNESWIIGSRPALRHPRLPQFDGKPFAHGCNIGVRRSVMDEHGRFDGRMGPVGDIEFGVRLWSRGVPLHFDPAVVVHYRLRPDPRATWRQARGTGRMYPLLVKQLRRSGISGPSRVAGVRNWLWLARQTPTLRDRMKRGRWCTVAGTAFGRIEGSVVHRAFYV